MTNKYEFTGDLLLPIIKGEGYEHDLACTILSDLFPSHLEIEDYFSKGDILATRFITVTEGSDIESVLNSILDKIDQLFIINCDIREI